MPIRKPLNTDKQIDFNTYNSVIDTVNKLEQDFGAKYKSEKNRYRFALITGRSEQDNEVYYKAEEYWWDPVNYIWTKVN